MDIRLLPKSEYPMASHLLKQLDLPYVDLDQEQVILFAFGKGRTVSAIGGLEQYGEHALLRSVAIIPGQERKGLGSQLLLKIEEEAIQRGISRLYLLTTTAAGFFDKKGYQRIERSQAPEQILQTTEFTSLCPDSAVCMMKKLKLISNSP
jgi:amino-acid N-acetyltransferase